MTRDLASCRKCVGAYHAAREADANNYFGRRLFEYYVNRLISSLGKIGNKGAGVILQRVLRSKVLCMNSMKSSIRPRRSDPRSTHDILLAPVLLAKQLLGVV